MQAHACEASGLLKAMGNEQRLLILCQLVGHELSVGELQADSQLSQSALSQHLAVLREADLVQTRREGQSIFYSLPHGPVHKVMQTLHDIYCGPEK
jgi:DNA-binding transcriptional ArsR family regulator